MQETPCQDEGGEKGFHFFVKFGEYSVLGTQYVDKPNGTVVTEFFDVSGLSRSNEMAFIQTWNKY